MASPCLAIQAMSIQLEKNLLLQTPAPSKKSLRSLHVWSTCVCRRCDDLLSPDKRRYRPLFYALGLAISPLARTTLYIGSGRARGEINGGHIAFKEVRLFDAMKQPFANKM